MDFEAVCRTCLGKESLNPIFKKTDHQNQFSVALMETTGLKIEPNDGLPQNICTDCISHINKSIIFRLQCKKTETKLLRNKNHYVYIKLDLENDSTETKTDKLDIKDEETCSEIDYNSDDEKPLHFLVKNSPDRTDSKYKNTIIPGEKGNLENNIEVKDGKLKDIFDTETKDIEYDEEIEIAFDGSNTEYLIEENLIVADSITESLQLEYKTEYTTCELCNSSLSIRNYEKHMRSHLECNYCKQQFESKELLVQHTAKCTDKKRKRRNHSIALKEMSECDVCHKKMQKGSLRTHLLVKHGGGGPVCDHCGRKFGNKFRLNEHLRAKHGYEKFKCVECDFQSASSMAMRNHERRHRGEKPFVCELCGASFHAAYLLAQHRQSHRTEKLFKCNLCPASFKVNNTLHMHKLSCHSKTSFKCTLCPRVYSCRHYAVKHLRTLHRFDGPIGNLEQKIIH